MRRLAAAVGLALLSVSCSLLAPATTPDRIAWDDYSPFARGLVDPLEILEHPFLRNAPVYHLTLRVGDDLTVLDGAMAVRYTNSTGRVLDSLDFALLPNIAPGSMTIGEIRVNARPAESELRDGDITVRVRFPRPLQPLQRAIVSIHYRLRIPTSPVVGFGGLLSFRGELALGYAYPMIPASGRWDWGKPPAWGDLTANPAAFYLVEMSYPEGLTLAAPGVTLTKRSAGGRTHLLFAFGPARDLFLALGKELQMRELRHGATTIRSYASGGLSAASPAILEEAGEALSLYNRQYGPYPYRTLSFVSTLFDAEGLEFPGMIILTTWLYDDPQKSVDGSSVGVALELTVAHETAHQWFYALVGNNQLTEPWIDESMAQYAMWLYWRERHGPERAERLQRSFAWDARNPGSALPIGRPVAAYSPRDYEGTIYGRGPLFLMALADRMGKAQFDGFVRQLSAAYRWRVVTGDDLRRAAERACACSLDVLWREWVISQP